MVAAVPQSWIDRADYFDYFPGPVFLAWQRVGNIKKWVGPLSESWCLAQRDLQKTQFGFALNCSLESHSSGVCRLPGISGNLRTYRCKAC